MTEATKYAQPLTERDLEILSRIPPAQPKAPDQTVVLNAIYRLSEDVRELREALVTPAVRLAALGLMYAERLP